ncbi:MAG: MFS transporter, partial [Rubrivivax sp.]|nr:MFS transporter [Rubrivivax sp.]
RHGFGLWLQPITMERGWTRETFSFAMAVQNLAFGLAGPLAGLWADKYGAFRVLMVSGALYAVGLVGMALTTTSAGFTGTAGLLIGMAQSGCTYAVIFGVIARNTPPEKRAWAMGMAAAAGSFGQFLMVPVENWLIGTWGWQSALFVLAGMALAILPLARGMKETPLDHSASPPQSIGTALREAFGYTSFRLLMAGYFVCGFHLVFIGVHLPSYLKDNGLSPTVATTALALIGLFNVLGTYGAGMLASHLAKRHILAGIYFLRALAIALFVLLPLTPWSVYVFASVMGLLWLSTVPATNAIVAQIFGVRYLSMLSGFVFLSHQVGSFMGAWLGGKLYDTTGSYTLMWWIAVALGAFAALINLPVRETAIVRAAPQAA